VELGENKAPIIVISQNVLITCNLRTWMWFIWFSCSVSSKYTTATHQVQSFVCLLGYDTIWYVCTDVSEAPCSSKMLVPTHKTTWCHTPEDNNLHDHCCENSKPHLFQVTFSYFKFLTGIWIFNHLWVQIFLFIETLL
jgi:hypothetical protein